MKKRFFIFGVILVLGTFVFFVHGGNFFYGRTSIIHDGIDDDPFAIDSGVKILGRRQATVNISFRNPEIDSLFLADLKAEPEVKEESVEEKIEPEQSEQKEVKKKKVKRKKVKRKKKKQKAGTTTTEITIPVEAILGTSTDTSADTSLTTATSSEPILPELQPEATLTQPKIELQEIPGSPASSSGTTTEPVQPEEPEDIFEFSEWFRFQDYGKIVNPGDSLRYKILVQNQGKNIETNFFVEADIPAGTEFIEGSAGFDLEHGKFTHQVEQGKIVVLLENLPPDEVFEMIYEVTVQKEKGNIEHRSRITRGGVTIAETVPLVNPLPKSDEASMREICFSKQYRKDLVEKTLQSEAAFDAEQELRKVFIGMPEAVDYFLKHRFDNEVREDFLRSLFALPCVQVPTDYPLPEWIDKKVEIQTSTFVVPSPESAAITIGTTTLPLETSSSELIVGTSTIGTTTSSGTSSAAFKVGASTNLDTSTLEIVPAPTATQSTTAPEPIILIPQEETSSTNPATSTEDYTPAPPHMLPVINQQ